MAKNNFQDLSNSELLTKVTQANAAVIAAGDPGYGLSLAQTGALAAAVTSLGTGITAAEDARTASKAATQQQDAGRAAALSILGSMGATIYNNPDVTDEMLADAGFTIHDDTRTAHAPLQPISLTTTPDQFGTVKFEWDTNGNVYPTTYVIEGRASESEAWSQVTTTTRRRISVSGFTPGASYMFRVKARRNGADSIYSNVSTIWTTEQVQLEVAA